MKRGYKFVNGKFVLCKERVDVFLIKYFGALSLGEDEVEEKEKAEPGVEWNPNSFPLAKSLVGFSHGAYRYQTRMNPTHDSASRAHARTTQYMSHGVNSAGSEVLRAL